MSYYLYTYELLSCLLKNVARRFSELKQYEPYFSDTSAYDEANNTGGVALQFRYDPLDRKIKTIHPDGSVERITFSPWLQKNYDQNDNDSSSPHYDSPQTQYFDSLGHRFITEDDNKAAGKYRVHQTLDIAGRPTVVTDAKGREMTMHLMGMQQPLKTTNIDSGTRWILSDAAGKPIYQWDSRNHQTKYSYDALQRPLQTELTENGSTYIVEKTIYGTDPSKNNIGQVEVQFDQSGKTEILSYDFKGNPSQVVKQFCEDYQNTINWSNTPTLQSESFSQSFAYDAINRPLSQSMPDGTVITNTYNKAGLLETVAKDGQSFVSNINYNAKGQRTAIYYGNNTKTKYEYDINTFRLTRLLTTRNNGTDILQDLNYTYDPVGNITQLIDNAQQTHYFKNAVVKPKGQYEYDALYRLTKATGRELASLQKPTHTDFPDNISMPNTASNAMQNYTQKFIYDELGNMMQMKSNGHWTRDYFYANNNNQLLGHTANTTEYSYDAHGNMLSMPHLSEMVWNYKDQLNKVNLDGGGTAYYVYDATGERVRKVIEKGNSIEERYYLGGCEVYRKTTNGTLDVERESLIIKDDTKSIAQIDYDGTTETIRYQYDNHLGSASLELDEHADIISYEEYHPFGTTSYRSGRTETEVSLKRYKYVGKERDEETGLYYYGARYYAVWLCRFVSVDPLAHLREWVSPYNFVQNNPINRIDPNGALDEVFMTGPDADKATDELNKSSSLEITRNAETGKLSATGEAKTASDKVLLEAIQSESVVVNLETKSEATYDSKDGTTGWPLVPAGFEGSEVKDGKTVATQYLNFGATQNVAKIVGEQTGETITHEIKEAYIGGRDYSGGDYNSAYQQSHTKAASTDRVKSNIEFNKNTKSDPNNIIMQGRQKGSSTWIDIIKIPKK